MGVREPWNQAGVQAMEDQAGQGNGARRELAQAQETGARQELEEMAGTAEHREPEQELGIVAVQRHQEREPAGAMETIARLGRALGTAAQRCRVPEGTAGTGMCREQE